jgi:hypothetical protein
VAALFCTVAALFCIVLYCILTTLFFLNPRNCTIYSLY